MLQHKIVAKLIQKKNEKNKNVSLQQPTSVISIISQRFQKQILALLTFTLTMVYHWVENEKKNTIYFMREYKNATCYKTYYSQIFTRRMLSNTFKCRSSKACRRLFPLCILAKSLAILSKSLPYYLQTRCSRGCSINSLVIKSFSH